MRTIFEEYGSTILQIIGGVVILGLILDLLHPDGSLRELIIQLADSAC